MDPVACIERLKIAVAENDRYLDNRTQILTYEADSALSDLWDWCEKGGFLPSVRGKIFEDKFSRFNNPIVVNSVYNSLKTLCFRVRLTEEFLADSENPDTFTWELVRYSYFGHFRGKYEFPS